MIFTFSILHYKAINDTIECIEYIKNNKNIGFAAANNLGYKYAKDVLKSDFIAVINNDAVVELKVNF